MTYAKAFLTYNLSIFLLLTVGEVRRVVEFFRYQFHTRVKGMAAHDYHRMMFGREFCRDDDNSLRQMVLLYRASGGFLAHFHGKELAKRLRINYNILAYNSFHFDRTLVMGSQLIPKIKTGEDFINAAIFFGHVDERMLNNMLSAQRLEELKKMDLEEFAKYWEEKWND